MRKHLLHISQACTFLAIVALWSVGCSKQETCLEDSDCPVQQYCDILRGACQQDCTDASRCKSDETCNARGRCIAKSQQCQAKAEQRCTAGHMYWYDSCGFQQEISQACGNEGCSAQGCLGAPVKCGDGTCNPGEDCTTCPADCTCDPGKLCQNGICQAAPKCGNGSCEPGEGESCESCPADCKCANGQSCQNGACIASSSCGNGSCEANQNETCQSCPADCKCPSGQTCQSGACKVPDCGNGSCEANKNETCASCPADCKCTSGQACQNGACQAALKCGNGTCESGEGENCTTCPNDCTCESGQTCQNGSCQSNCGNGSCDSGQGEGCNTCPADCKCASGQACQSNACVSCACTPSQRRCQNNRVEQCKNDCTGWLVVQTCSASQTCRNGSCQASCGNGTCDRSQGENCSTCPADCKCASGQACQSNACVSCTCTPGTKRCSGTFLQTCKSDCSGWSNTEECKSTNYRYCSSTAKACACSTLRGCPTFGEYRCSSTGERQFCTRNSFGCNYWKASVNQCSGSTPTCDNGTCCACKVGDKRCSGSTLQECRADCKGWDDKEECKIADRRYCSTLSKACKCLNACSTLGQYRCSSTGERQFCTRNSFGCNYWKPSVSQCTGSTTCKDGKCCTCTPGEKECVDINTERECSSTCTSWTTRTCSTLQFCISGECKGI